jgi:hypothetical protein
MKKTTILFFCILFSLVVTLVSVGYKHYETMTKEQCAEIRVDCDTYRQLSGGFPLAYLFDVPEVSVEAQLSFIEDDVNVNFFLLDWFIHSSVLSAGIFIIIHFSKKLSVHGVEKGV